jgi:hypothetical protein
MKNFLKIAGYAGCLLALFAAAACSGEDDKTPPADITGLKGVDGLPGQIALRWDLPDKESNIHQIKVTYYDHLSKKDVLRAASIYADSINIPNTRKRYGEYAFTVQPFTRSGVGGAEQTVKATSGAAPGYYITGAVSDTTLLPLKAENLYTNAQQATEGPIENLLDGNKETFFHTTWSSGGWTANSDKFLGDLHFLQVDFGKVMNPSGDYFSFHYAPRNNDANKPTDFDLYGSLTADDSTTVGKAGWFLIKNFTKDGDNLPTDQTTEYNSPMLAVEQPLQYIRIAVKASNNDGKANGAVFWTMSEFKIWTYKASQVYYDPEKDEQD